MPSSHILLNWGVSFPYHAPTILCKLSLNHKYHYILNCMVINTKTHLVVGCTFNGHMKFYQVQISKTLFGIQKELDIVSAQNFLELHILLALSKPSEPKFYFSSELHCFVVEHMLMKLMINFFFSTKDIKRRISKSSSIFIFISNSLKRSIYNLRARLHK